MTDWHLIEPRFRALVSTGCSARHLADVLNDEFGTDLTRSAVIGKAHRLSLHIGDTPAPKNSSKGKPKVRVPKIQPVAFPLHDFPDIEPEPMLGYEPVSILNVRYDQCRWIEGDDYSGDCCCGEKTKLGSSFCDPHHSRVFVKQRRRTAAEISADDLRRRLAVRGASLRVLGQ
jgi:hypothetical protein